MSIQEEIRNRLVMEQETPGELMPYHARIRLEKSCCAFQGHFPENPILPGIAIVALAQCFIECSINMKISLRGLKRTKFFQMVPPDMELILSGNARFSDALVFAEVRISDTDGKRISTLSMELTKETK